MAMPHRPTWTNLEELVRSASTRLWLCSPYVKDAGLGRVSDALGDASSDLAVRVWTRLSPSDWAAGASDPESLLSFLQLMEESAHPLEFAVNQRLHAKLYVADDTMALLTSANLSAGGFERNLELSARLEGREVLEAIRVLEEEGRLGLRVITTEGLSRWLEQHRKTIEAVRAQDDPRGEALAGAQADLDRFLGFGQRGRARAQPTVRDLEDFGRWLEENQVLPGADVVLQRHRNSDGQNLTGHVKQSFAGLFRFLLENRGFIDQLSAALETVRAGRIFDLDLPGLVDAWVSFLDDHATDSSDFYSHSVLRGILPPSVGGTRYGGGGGISTFKRMAPLVARYLKEINA